ncbi:galactose-binding domain-containing protein [Aestuariibaculum suncheonense]|uniref:Discoidin domain-containing protein n=1 Tax=Aestuariibaculum suncheonense TaxID=1028745 RepID=A0A8J6QW51_9FLAO|nr:discoidin domain-containing protein [Aestuariibaculum suncheonense]MBD0836064.1 discoidin domain-containing protein [Aestuariibaculum suncheonense]
MKKRIFMILAVFSLVVFSGYGQQVNRAQKLFIKHGLQFQTWSATGGHEWPIFDNGVTSRVSNVYGGSKSVRYIRVQLPGESNEILSLAEVQVFSGGVNVALNKVATQSSTNGSSEASRAVDGNTNGDINNASVTHTQSSSQPWWEVDLGANYDVESVMVYNRTDCCGERLRGYYILASPNPFVSTSLSGALAENGVVLVGPHFPVADEYTNLPFVQGFYEKPMFSPDFFNRHPNALWSMEKAPYGTQLDMGPTASEVSNGFLDAYQLEKVGNLVTLGFGDEENYSNELKDWFKQWFDLSKAKYPDVLLHNNQYVNQWSDSQMRTYIQQAQPDFISFDNYLFNESQVEFDGGSLRSMYNYLGRYRRLALEGIDGDGNLPIEFGQYTIGFRQGSTQAGEGGLYYTSESQIYGEVFGALTMGAKWLSAWRYNRWDRSYWIDNAGNLLPGYYWYANALKEFKNLSPHLSRLQTTDVRFIPGEHLFGGNAVSNLTPNEVAIWDAVSDPDPYITGITASNMVSGTNHNLKGDVLIGYFKPVKNLSTDTDISMGPIHHKDAKYFMIMNGLTKASGCCHESSSSLFQDDINQGLASLAKQTITLNIDFGENPVDVLKRVNPTTGVVEEILLTQVSGNEYTVDIVLDGGKADLFYWESAHSVVNIIPYNLALNKPANESSVQSGALASRAVDGDTSGNWIDGSVAHTLSEFQPWWQVDLGNLADITNIKLYNRTDCCADRMTNYYVLVSENPFQASETLIDILTRSDVYEFYQTSQMGRPTSISINQKGRYVRLQLQGTNAINMAEVEVYGTFSNALSIQENRLNEFKIYPNPLKRGETLKINREWGNSFEGEPLEVSIFSITGKKIYTKKILPENGKSNVEINVEQLTTGVYFIELLTGSFSETKKIVVK